MSSKGAVLPTDVPVLRVVAVDVHGGSTADFAAELERGRPILRRCGVEAEVRAWQATYAGSDTGSVMVTLEFPSFAAFARSEQAYADAPKDAEFAQWASGLDALRSLMADSLYVELAP